MQEAVVPSRKLPRKLQLPERRNRFVAEFDRDAIEYMIGVLEISQPVYVSWTRDDPNKPGQRGSHRWLRGTHHHIDVSFDAKPGDANRFLLHELTHASQSECFPTYQAWRDAYDGENERHGYTENSYEREARAIVHEFHDDFRLVK